METKNIVIFGAGQLGRKAFEHYGKDSIVNVIDNSLEKIGGGMRGFRLFLCHSFLRKGPETRRF